MSLVNWKEKEKKQRRHDIIDTARKLFFDTDYDSFLMTDMANEMLLFFYLFNEDSFTVQIEKGA